MICDEIHIVHGKFIAAKWKTKSNQINKAQVLLHFTEGKLKINLPLSKFGFTLKTHDFACYFLICYSLWETVIGSIMGY